MFEMYLLSKHLLKDLKFRYKLKENSNINDCKLCSDNLYLNLRSLYFGAAL